MTFCSASTSTKRSKRQKGNCAIGLVILDGGWIRSLPLSSATIAAGDSDTVGPAALGNISR
ncbi:hypothetical protein B0E45_29840 [Sinorhizobium sp. A49]|nr:hypothetical protein B0E45_29840 [Sinorhizobium sp. A49]